MIGMLTIIAEDHCRKAAPADFVHVHSEAEGRHDGVLAAAHLVRALWIWDSLFNRSFSDVKPFFGNLVKAAILLHLIEALAPFVHDVV